MALLVGAKNLLKLLRSIMNNTYDPISVRAIRELAFSQIKGLNLGTARELLKRIGSVSSFFDYPAHELQRISGLPPKLCSESARQELLDKAAVEAAFIEQNRIRCISFISDEYPTLLSECNDAPAMLFLFGPVTTNNYKMISVVGTRHATALGMEWTTRFINDLSKLCPNVLIVSGLAYGIDIAAHKAAINAGLKTVAVMAHGLNMIYPADHRKYAKDIITAGGGIITEYLSSAPIHKGNFLARNRIVAGLSHASIIVESDMRGGAMATARIAGEYNREVFAVPGRPTDRYSRGCNELIATNRANLVRDAADFMDVMGWDSKPLEGEQQELFVQLPPHKQQIIDFLQLHPDSTVNDMCVSLSKPFHELTRILFELEMDNRIIALPGSKYAVLT